MGKGNKNRRTSDGPSGAGPDSSTSSFVRSSSSSSSFAKKKTANVVVSKNVVVVGGDSAASTAAGGGGRAVTGSVSGTAATATASPVESSSSSSSVSGRTKDRDRKTMKMVFRWLAFASIIAFVWGFVLGSTVGGGDAPRWVTDSFLRYLGGQGAAASSGLSSPSSSSPSTNQSIEPWKVRLGQRLRSSWMYKLMYPEHLRKKQLEHQRQIQQKKLMKKQKREQKRLQRRQLKQQSYLKESVEGTSDDEGKYVSGGLKTHSGPINVGEGENHGESNGAYDDDAFYDEDDDDDDDELSGVLDSYQHGRIPSRLELYTIGVLATLIEWSGLFNFTDYAIREYQKEKELKKFYMSQQRQQQQQPQPPDDQAFSNDYKGKQESSQGQNRQREVATVITSSPSSDVSGGDKKLLNEYEDAFVVTNVLPPVGSKNYELYDAPLREDPSHPFVYSVLREAIVREKGGYVHYDLGILEPAPCGAARGIGMVRNIYGKCQQHCMPGIASEKIDFQQQKHNETSDTNTDPADTKSRRKSYFQEEVLIKVPLSYQMTRKVALDTLLPRIPAEVQAKASLYDLDDFVLLTLLLAHERGVGAFSRWLPYIASLPLEPSCGYSASQRPYKLDALNVLRYEYGVDVNGWMSELMTAQKNADRIVASLNKDYGSSISHPKDVSSKDNLSWALCQVASRAVGGKAKYGTLRLVPLLDMVNHGFNFGAFVELTGEERLGEGDFIDAIDETDKGAYVLRSLRHGRRKALKIGQELLANYNVPHYAALDWFINMGFVPTERYSSWTKLDAPLPRIRRDGPFADPSYEASSASPVQRHVLYNDRSEE